MATASPIGTSTSMDVSAGVSPTGNSNGGDSSNSPATSTPRDTIKIENAAAQPGVTIIDPNQTPSSILNPRSCVTCRRRKVRCDKQMPCGNCRKAHISCIFPAPGRAPRRPRPKDPNAPPKQTSEREIELMSRLRKLEGIVEELSGQIEVDGRHSSSAGQSPGDGTENGFERDRRKTVSSASQSLSGAGPYPPGPGRLARGPGTWGGRATEVHKDFGRLVLNDNGKSRYVSNAFWSKMNDELDQLRAETQKLTDDETDESENDDDHESPSTTHSIKELDHHAFILGYRSSDVDLRALHPPPTQIPFIWLVFTENVDPLVKILHVPTMQEIIHKMTSNIDSISPDLEALMFSIYYAAITSMEDADIQSNFNIDKPTLINRYRFATEQALAKANFLNTSELRVVQAFTLFLMVVRRHDQSRFSWTLTGLLIRIAQSLGIHREGTHFTNLTPFQIEMRRRLWWAICALDLRSAEDQGTELSIAERTFDTRLPLNINDADIDKETKEFPPERAGTSEMTFSLVRYEVCTLARRLNAAANSLAPCPKDAALTLQQREDMLLEMFDRVEERYLKPIADQNGNLHWVATALARLIMAKMSLIVYQPMLFPDPGQDVAPKARERLFTSAIEVVEYQKMLNSESKAKQYRWLFQTYTQWHAMAYILLEICRRPWSSSVERAWTALNESLMDFEPNEYAKLQEHRAVWIPIRKLMLKAKRHRDQEIERLRADPQAAEQLELEEVRRAPPLRFSHLPSYLRVSHAKNRWRKLVGRPETPKPAGGACPLGEPQATTTEAEAAQSAHHISQEQLSQSYDAIDSAMAEAQFTPIDLWSIAFNPNSAAIARQSFFGAGVPAVQQQQQQQQFSKSQTPAGMNTLPTTSAPMTTSSGIPFPPANTISSPSTTSISGTNPSQMQTPSTAQSGTVPSSVSSVIDDNPPPWLWPNALRWNETDPAPTSMQVPEDGDVNMEDFNWQDWQQSIGKFEMDSGIGLGMNGAGFSGGI